MAWGTPPKSWFGNMHYIVNKCFMFIPLIGQGNRPIYMVNIDDLVDSILMVFKNRKYKKFVIYHKKTFNFREIIEKIVKKESKLIKIIPIHASLIFIIFKILNFLKLLSFNSFDSLKSYSYAKKHKFRGYKIINTKKSFKIY